MSDTEIVNLGLGCAQISARIDDLDTDTSKEARTARDCYTRKRDALLREYLWSFAKKRAVLAPVITVPAFGFDTAFELPADFLRTIAVHPSDSDYSRMRYKMETVEVSGSPQRVIVTNGTTLYLRYVAKQTLTGMWDPMFVDAFAWDLGAHFSLVIRESSAQASECRKAHMMSIAKAKAANAIEDWPDEFPEGSWVTTRDGEDNLNWCGW